MSKYSRPVRGCSNVGCGAAAGGELLFCCLGLLTLVLLLANSSRIVCGMSGSNRTPFFFLHSFSFFRSFVCVFVFVCERER